MKTTAIKKKCVLLLASSDKYVQEACLTAELLENLNFNKYFKCYALFGDSTPALPADFKILNRKNGKTWSSELIDGLAQIKEDYLLLWLDDLVPLRINSFETIVDGINWLISNDGDYLRLNPLPPGSGKKFGKSIVQILPGEIYRTSTVLSVWKKSTLIDLLSAGESAWDFEIKGSIRSDKYSKFYAFKNVSVFYKNLVVKGLINPKAESILNAFGVNTSHLKRLRMSRFQYFILNFYNLRSYFFQLIPFNYRRDVRNFFK
jgi:hypothetical protein